MGPTFSTPTSTLARTPFRVLFTLLVALSLVATQLVGYAASPAGANPLSNTLSFEIDGNATTDNPGTKIDWDSAQGVRFKDDPLDSDDDIVFKGGSKEHTQSTWQLERKKATPAKSDLAKTFATGGVVAGDPYLYFGFVIGDPGNEPSFSGNMEFNQSEETLDLGLLQLPLRTPGDILVAVDYLPNQTLVRTYRWSTGGAWVSQPTAVAATGVNVQGEIELPGTLDGGTAGIRRFVEASVNLAPIFAAQGCANFAQAYAKTRTSGGNPFEATLVDVTDTIPVNLNFCASATIRKVNAANTSEGLAGANFEVWQIDADGDRIGSAAVGSCTTGSDGYCTENVSPAGFLDNLDSRLRYEAEETTEPAGFKPAEQKTQKFTVQIGSANDLVFLNPPIDYEISVDPAPATNPVGSEHRFVVTLSTDYVPGEFAGPGFTPLGGAEVELTWSGPTGSSVVSISDEVGTQPSPTAPLSCTTLTEDDTEDEKAKEGTCSVIVNSSAAGGPGTLTATYRTGRSGGAATDPAHATDGSNAGSISDSSTKSWVGYQASLSPDAINLLGDDHTFTATVDFVDGNAHPSAPDHEVEVTFEWDGPEGSEFKDDVDSCKTAPAGADDAGTCTVTVTSPDAPGAGTLSIIRLDGEIVDEEPLVIDFPASGGATEENRDQVIDAVKSWIAVDVSLTPPSAVNLVGESHDFALEATIDDGGAGVELSELSFCLQWLGPDGTPNTVLDAEGCMAALVSETKLSGTATFTVDAPANAAAGYGELQLDEVRFSIQRGTASESFTLDADAVSGLGQNTSITPSTGLSFPLTADKLWADYSLAVTPEVAINALPTSPGHTFTVTLRSSDPGSIDAEGGYQPGSAPVGDIEIDLSLDSNVSSVTLLNGVPVGEDFDPSDFTCTTEAVRVGGEEGETVGRCTVTVLTTGPGTAKLTAEYLAIADGKAELELSDDGVKHWSAISLDKVAVGATHATSDFRSEDGDKVIRFRTDQNPGIITYEYTIRNASPIDLAITSLVDDILGDLTDRLPEDLVLVPGGSHTLTSVTHTVTSADIGRGHVTNQADVFAGPHDERFEGQPIVTARDTERVEIQTFSPPPPPPPVTPDPVPSIGLVKTANPTSIVLPPGADATAVVIYTYTATNTGPGGAQQRDDDRHVLGPLTAPLRTALGSSTLPVGGSVTFTVPQTVGVGDIGTLVNVATVTGTSPYGNPTATDDASVDISQVAGVVLEPGISIVKTAIDGVWRTTRATSTSTSARVSRRPSPTRTSSPTPVRTTWSTSRSSTTRSGT
jgi:hypothetical protein